MGLSALDDRDSSIDYSKGWEKAGSNLEFNRTTTWSVVAGSTAKVTFQGTSIGVYGTVGAKSRRSIAPVSEYSIDGGSQVEFTPTQAAKAQYSQLFFQSPVMSDGSHTLTITNKLAADPLFLDFVLVLDTASDSTATGALPTLSSAVPGSSTSSSSVASSTSSLSTSSVSSTSSSTSSAASSTSSPPPNTVTVTSIESQGSSSASGVADNASSPSGSAAAGDVRAAAKKSNAGPIVGGVLAGIIILLILVFGVLYWNRKRQRRNSFMDYKAAGSGSYWNRPLEAAATPASIPPPQTIEPFPVNPPRPPMKQTDAPNITVYPYAQPRYPGGYMPATPGPDYYESSDLAYAVNPVPASAYNYSSSRESDIYAAQQVQPVQSYPSSGYVPPSQLMHTPTNNYDYNRGMPPPQSNYYSAQNQSGERVRTRLD